MSNRGTRGEAFGGRVGILISLMTACLSCQTTWYVDAAAIAPGTGSQSSPFTNIQAAINFAISGDVIQVSPGTYFENLVINGKSVDLVSSDGPTATVIDGGQAGPVVVIFNAPSPGGSVSGFTLVNGRGLDGQDGQVVSTSSSVFSCIGWVPYAGIAGGINCGYSSTTIRNCIVTGNTGGDGGDGGRCTHGNPFGGSSTTTTPSSGARAGPGGILLFESSSVIENCRIQGNAGGDGGDGESAVNCDPANPTSCSASNGSGGDGGAGGIDVISSGPSALIAGCEISSNVAGSGGRPGLGIGGISPSYGDGGDGGVGGARIAMGSMVNCSIVANLGGMAGQASLAGGASGQAGAGGIDGGSAVNCVAWMNSGGDAGGAVSITYSNLGVSTPGMGNISVNPQFADPAGADYHLLPGSPCIDAGSNGASGIPLLDIDGEVRIFNGTVDMGADESGLFITLSQPSGGGTAIQITNEHLTVGNEYYNLFSFDPCPGAVGDGPYLGLCASTASSLQFIIDQVFTPVGTAPFHFVAPSSSVTWGPFPLVPVTLDAICLDVTGGSVGHVSLAYRITVQ